MQGRRRSQVHAVLGVAIYALFLVTAPFEHHDLLCHLKTPSHCTACTSSVVSADPNTPFLVGAADLADAGRTLAQPPPPAAEPVPAVQPGAAAQQPTAQVPPGAEGAGGPQGALPVYGGAVASSKVFNPDIAVIGDFLGAAGKNPVQPDPFSLGG